MKVSLKQDSILIQSIHKTQIINSILIETIIIGKKSLYEKILSIVLINQNSTDIIMMTVIIRII